MIAAIDFFCGSGGLTRGLMDAGIRVIAGFDIDRRCRCTYEKNNHPARFYAKDVRALTKKDLAPLIKGIPRLDLLFAGCAPCQSFSQQRKAETPRPDATLLVAFARLVEAFKPGQVLVENVPGLTRVAGFSAYRRFIRVLESLGYLFAEGTLDAKYFGVPQTRRRYVLIAMRKEQPTLPERITGVRGQPFATVRDALSHYPPIAAGERHTRIPNHVAASISEKNLLRLRHTPHDGGDRRSWPDELTLNCHRNNNTGHTDVYGRMAWDSPAPTLTGRCHSISNGRYGHPSQDRAISLREAASLQTFRDDYIFYGSNKNVALQIGNSVPVRLAELLGRHILSLSAT